MDKALKELEQEYKRKRKKLRALHQDFLLEVSNIPVVDIALQTLKGDTSIAMIAREIRDIEQQLKHIETAVYELKEAIKREVD